MRIVPGTDYHGYTYFIDPGRNETEWFYDAFSIYKNAEGGSCQRVTDYQRPQSLATKFPQVDQAITSAKQLAECWIDQHK